MINLLKRIAFLPFILLPSLSQAKEINQQDFLHDFFNTTILHIGMDNGCGTIDEELYKFIVRGSADYLMDEQNWTIDEAKDFLKAIAIHIHQTTTDYIQKNGCDMFNFVVIENKDDYRIIDDVYDIYFFEETVDNEQIVL